MFFDKDITAARYYAIEIHGNQKYDEFPYIKHPEDVYKVLIEFGIEDKALLMAAFLHDAIEDGATSYHKISIKFNKEVAELVFAVTDELGRNRNERHEKTYPKIRKNLNAIILKLADRIANVTYSKSSQAKTSLLQMYKKEQQSFKENLIYENLNKDSTRDMHEFILEKMWLHLDSLFLPSPLE